MEWEDIKKLRVEKGYTQMEAARKIGVSVVGYRLWELGGVTPNPKNMKKLKKVLL